MMSNNLPSLKFDPCCTLEHIEGLNLESACSEYNLLDTDLDTKISTEFNNYNMNKDLLVENESIRHGCENALSDYSNHDIYDENNNCMLTNLNEFGLRFFDCIEEIKTNCDSSEKHDDSLNDYNEWYDTCTEDENRYNSNCKIINNLTYQKNVSSNIEICNSSKIYNDEIIPYFKLELQNNSKEDTKEEEYLTNNNEYLENDFEHILKCNLIVKDNFKNTKDVKEDRELEDIREMSCIYKKSENGIISESSNEETVESSLGDGSDIVQNVHEIDKSDTYSYHSSDFEFIDELEASKKLPIDLNITNCHANDNILETTDKSKEFDNDNVIYDYFDNSKRVVTKGNFIPTGNDFNNLFLSSCIPYPCRNMENKAVQSMSGMKVCDSTGFDMKYLNLQTDPDDNYKEEAYESAKIILSMYPNENRGRRPQRRLY